PSGHLIFLHNGTLFAESFDLAHLEVTSSPVPVIDSISTNPTLGAGLFAVSNAGTLAYTPSESASSRTRPIEWIDRSGKAAALLSGILKWGDPRTGAISRSRLTADESRSTSGPPTCGTSLWPTWHGARRRG